MGDSVSLYPHLPPSGTGRWPVLIREAVRYTGERDTLPLCPLWIARQFKEASPLCEGDTCSASAQSDACPTRMARRLSGGTDAG